MGILFLASYVKLWVIPSSQWPHDRPQARIVTAPMSLSTAAHRYSRGLSISNHFTVNAGVSVGCVLIGVTEALGARGLKIAFGLLYLTMSCPMMNNKYRSFLHG